MKKRPVFLGVLLAFGLAFVGCPTDDKGGDGNNDGPVYLGNTLELSGQVYLMNYDEYTISYQPFNGNLTISDNDLGGSGEIKNGKLTYSIGTPNWFLVLDSFLDDLFDGLDNYFDNVLVSTTDVVGLVLYLYDSDNYEGLSKRNKTYSEHGNSASGTYETVSYVFVTDDVTISGKGKSNTDYDESSTWTDTSKNFNLALKAGWNAVHFKQEFSATFKGPIDNPTSETATMTTTISLGNPSLKWVLFDYDDPDDYSATLDRRPLLNAPAIK